MKKWWYEFVYGKGSWVRDKKEEPMKETIDKVIEYHIMNAPEGKEFSHYEKKYSPGLSFLGGGWHTDFTKPVYKDKIL